MRLVYISFFNNFFFRGSNHGSSKPSCVPFAILEYDYHSLNEHLIIVVMSIAIVTRFELLRYSVFILNKVSCPFLFTPVSVSEFQFFFLLTIFFSHRR